MSIELTKEQLDQLEGERAQPAAVRDPRSNRNYVLVPTDQYEQMLQVIEEDAEQRSLRRAGARALARRAASEDA
jgi:hypothetical protein